MLERICELAPRERLVANTLRLVEAYAAAGNKGAARARLEHAIELLEDADALSDRLSNLYREEEAWAVLADFLASQASRTKDAGKRLSLLTQAIEIQSAKLHSTKGAIPLLEQVVELAPDNVQPRLVLADAFIETRRPRRRSRSGRADCPHGSRKPKERARAPFAGEGPVSPTRSGPWASSRQAARIDPKPGRHSLHARLALEEGEPSGRPYLPGAAHASSQCARRSRWSGQSRNYSPSWRHRREEGRR
jgi:tetratricopeptide (TPR) repeat protein